MTKPDQNEHKCEDLSPQQLTKASTRRYLVIIMSSLLAGLFCFGFIPRFFQTRKVDRLAEKQAPVEVTAMIAKPQDAPVELLLPSVTQANHVTPIWARTNGYLVDLLVDIGDVVKKGQLLAVLDTPEVDQQYDQAVFDYKNAVVRRNIAQLNADRAQTAYETDSGSISKLDRDQFIATFLSAEEDVQSFEANMNRFKDLMEFKNIVAPFDGIIIERNVDLGSLISAGSNGTPKQLFVIAVSDIVRVFVSVPQTFFRSIHEGVEGTTKIREFGDKTFKGVVARYAKALDPTAHTMLTELHIDNSSGEILPGLYADVTFRFEPSLPYFIVPTPAVIIRAGDPKIAVLDDHNIAHLKQIQIGLDYGKTLEIVSGLEPNDRVIINPTERVREGVQCEVVETQLNDKYFFPKLY